MGARVGSMIRPSRQFVSTSGSHYPCSVPARVSIVWFRQDLRLADNPALAAACKRGAVIPVYIWAPQEEGAWAPGAASRVWLHQSLLSLSHSLEQRGSALILRSGASLATLQELIGTSGASAVYWNGRYEPQAVARDAAIKQALREQGCEAESFNCALLREPWEVQTGGGKAYQVFTAFWRTCLRLAEPAQPLPAPPRISAPGKWPRSQSLRSLALEPKIDWAGGIRRAWQPGEAGAQEQLKRFLRDGLDEYSTGRDRPAQSGTSRLSPHLHFGEIGPRQIWHAVAATGKKAGAAPATARATYLREIGWREFAFHLLYHFPETPEKPLRSAFSTLEWLRDKKGLAAWQRGRTGYPVVDAGMRELWTTGWMHNRVRMIVASFLTKDLLISWQRGAKWFWDTLVDADLANNTLGWQWTAGCGADAAPFFRIFNPVAQGKKFDPQGDYVRRWCPELAALPAKWIHRPWEAPREVLRDAGVALGENYPQPIVDHARARQRALAAFAGMRKAKTPAQARGADQ